jgi:hypothetical protein
MCDLITSVVPQMSGNGMNGMNGPLSSYPGVNGWGNPCIILRVMVNDGDQIRILIRDSWEIFVEKVLKL